LDFGSSTGTLPVPCFVHIANHAAPGARRHVLGGYLIRARTDLDRSHHVGLHRFIDGLVRHAAAIDWHPVHEE